MYLSLQHSCGSQDMFQELILLYCVGPGHQLKLSGLTAVIFTHWYLASPLNAGPQ